MSEAGVEFANVGYGWGPDSQSRLLHGISLKLEEGTTTALLGQSGSGKTTMLRMVNALVMPSSGAVRVAGRATGDWNLLELRRGIGYVIQESGLFPHRRIGSNVGMPLEIAGQQRDVPIYTAKVQHAMELVGLDFDQFAKRFPSQLSGGQRQRAGVARALVADAGILLMDEPFGALDPITRAEMQTMLKDLLRRVRKTVLLVTHDLNEALFVSDRVVFLDRGRVAADLASADVGASEDAYVRRYVAAVHPRPQVEP